MVKGIEKIDLLTQGYSAPQFSEAKPQKLNSIFASILSRQEKELKKLKRKKPKLWKMPWMELAIPKQEQQ